MDKTDINATFKMLMNKRSKEWKMNYTIDIGSFSDLSTSDAHINADTEHNDLNSILF
jgi:hypothetical protein